MGQKQLSRAEMRKTIAASLGTAFGLVIALLWNNVVFGGLKVAGISLDAAELNLFGWLSFLVTAVVLTVVMVIMIVFVSRWGSKE